MRSCIGTVPNKVIGFRMMQHIRTLGACRRPKARLTWGRMRPVDAPASLPVGLPAASGVLGCQRYPVGGSGGALLPRRPTDPVNVRLAEEATRKMPPRMSGLGLGKAP